MSSADTLECAGAEHDQRRKLGPHRAGPQTQAPVVDRYVTLEQDGRIAERTALGEQPQSRGVETDGAGAHRSGVRLSNQVEPARVEPQRVRAGEFGGEVGEPA